MKKLVRLLTVALLAAVAVSNSYGQDLSKYADAQGNQKFDVVTLIPDTVYNLDIKYYVGEGQVLNIMPGTVIKAATGTGLAAKAIIVTRGAKIYALGTKSDPIIMTSVNDPLDGSYSLRNQGDWGGLLVLGRAYTNLLGPATGQTVSRNEFGVQNGEGTIEGLDIPDDRHHYGEDRWENTPDDLADPAFTAVGDLKTGGAFDDADNSGIMRYVSIRHGGAIIGTANEINGLTLGGVGSGTIIENIEVIANQDDGIEFFGGAANVKYASILFCDDDYFDWDQGWYGKAQFIYGLQLPANVYDREGDNGFEMDGDDDDANPDAAAAPVPTVPSSGNYYSDPTIYNATLIGNQGDEGFELKERTEGKIANSIIANFSNAIEFDDSGNDRPIDAYQNWVDGKLELLSNTFVGNSNFVSSKFETFTAADLTKLTTTDGNVEATAGTVIDYTLSIDANTNTVTDGVNPVPAQLSDVNNAAALPAGDAFFMTADYRGAFEPGVAPWTEGWTIYEQLDAIDNSVADCLNDLNNDNQVDGQDYAILVGQFGSQCGINQ